MRIKILGLMAAVLFFLAPQAGHAGINKLWGDGLNISQTNGTGSTYGYGRKASDDALLVYYMEGDRWSCNNIYVQKIGKDGGNLWGGVGKMVDYCSSIIDMAPDQNGGAVVVFSRSLEWWHYEIRAKRFDSNGNEDTSWGMDGILIPGVLGGYGWGPHNSAVSDGAGGAIAVWQGYDGIYAQRVGSDGQLKWNNGEPAFVGNGGLYHGWTEANNVVPDGNGGVFIAWNGYNRILSAQHLDSNGISQWQLGGIVVDNYNVGQVGDLKPDGMGGVMITAGNSEASRVKAYRVDGQGNLPWGNNGIIVKNIANYCWGPRLTFIQLVGNSEFVVVWDGMEADAASCNESNVYAQKIDIEGNLKWNSEGVIVSARDQFDYFPHVTTDGSNGVWISFGNGDDSNQQWQGNGYFGVQHLDNDGNTFTCRPIRQRSYNSDTWGHSLVPDGDGGAYLLWDGVGGLGDIYAQRFAKVGQRQTACGPIPVTIDIKPGSYPNSINLSSKGVVPVAVLTTDGFDALTIDTATVVFAGANAVHSAAEDVNGDGRLDMVFHFDTQKLNLDSTSTSATLTGKTVDGNNITGEDSVNIVPKNK